MRWEDEVIFVRQSKETIEEDRSPFTDEFVNPEQSNTAESETAEKSRGDVP